MKPSVIGRRHLRPGILAALGVILTTVTVITAPTGADPSEALSSACRNPPDFPARLALVTPAGIAVASLATLALLGFGTAIVGRAVFGAEQEDHAASTGSSSRRLVALWLGALFLVVFSAKLLLMRETAVTSPFWDQWDGEADRLFVPFDACRLTWRAMFSLFNEHRIFFPRLVALDLLVANGQWDPRLEQVVNAGLHALTAVLTVAVCWLTAGRRRLDVLVFLVAVSFAPPFAWENTLEGFQSAFYFLLLFSILALWLTTAHAPGTRPWLLGWVCAACGLFTSASGVVVPVTIAATVLLQLASDRRGGRAAAINIGAAGLVLVLGLAVSSPPLAQHASLKAATLARFALALANNLAWPWTGDPGLSLVMWLPLAALLAAAAWRRARTTAFERLIIGLAIWVALHAVAVAYGRGGGALLPLSRYMDFLSLGLVANGLALLAILDRMSARSPARRLATAALVGWMLFAVAGVDRLTGQATTTLLSWRVYFAAHAASVRHFMVTGDRAALTAKPPLYELPYPDRDRLRLQLQDAYIRRILPASIREPLHLEQRSTGSPFVMQRPDGGVPYDPLAPAWWSLAGDGRRSQAQFESEPVRCRAGGYLKFQVAGYLGWENQYLAVRELPAGREVAVRPDRLAREDWTDAVVRCPPAAFQVIAIDRSTESWFGFREPVETGWLSLRAEWLIGEARELLMVALALAFLAARWT